MTDAYHEAVEVAAKTLEERAAEDMEKIKRSQEALDELGRRRRARAQAGAAVSGHRGATTRRGRLFS